MFQILIIDFQVILFLCGQDSDSGSDSNLWSDSDSRFESLKKRIFDKLSMKGKKSGVIGPKEKNDEKWRT